MLESSILCDYFILHQYSNSLSIVYHFTIYDYLILTPDMIICGIYAWALSFKKSCPRFFRSTFWVYNTLR